MVWRRLSPGGRRGSRSALSHSSSSHSSSSHSSSSGVAAPRRASENPHFWKHLLIVSDLTLSQADVSHRIASNTVTFFAMSDAVSVHQEDNVSQKLLSVHHLQFLDDASVHWLQFRGRVWRQKNNLTFSNSTWGWAPQLSRKTRMCRFCRRILLSTLRIHAANSSPVIQALLFDS